MSGGLSNRDLQLLRMVALLKVATANEEPPKKNDERKSAGWFSQLLQLLNSTVVVALVTVGVGGAIGNILFAKYQEGVNRRALENADAKTRIAQRGTSIEAAYELLSEGGQRAADLVDLTSLENQTINVDKKDLPKLEKQRTSVIDEDNAFNRKWNRERFTTRFRLSYYFHEHPPVKASWDRCVEALDALRDSADEIYQKYLDERQPPQSIADYLQKEEAFHASLDGLADALEKAREADIPATAKTATGGS